jgi:hypothetical protein
MGSIDFLSAGYEIVNTGTIKEGIVPVPPYRPYA